MLAEETLPTQQQDGQVNWQAGVVWQVVGQVVWQVDPA